MSHVLDPYPTDEQKQYFVQKTGLNLKQVFCHEFQVKIVFLYHFYVR